MRDAADRQLYRAGVLALLFAPAAIAAPLVLQGIPLPFYYQQVWERTAFDLFAATAPIVLAIAIAVAWRTGRQPDGTPGEPWPLLGLVAGALIVAGLIVSARAPSRDFQIYLEAAALVRAGALPYAGGNGYLYPPFLAQLLAWAAGRWTPETLFFVYQAIQWPLAIGLYLAAYAWTRRLGASPRVAALLAAAALAMNVPLGESIRYSQPILAVVLSTMCAFAIVGRWPVAAGLLLTVGTQLKLYPILLVPVLWRHRRYRALAAWAISMVIWTAIPGTAAAWAALPAHLAATGRNLFTNASIWSLGYNAAAWSGLSDDAAQSTAKLLQMLTTAGVIAWMSRRLLQHDATADPARTELHDAADWMAVAALASPLAWRHTFLMALPLALGGLGAAADRRTGRAVAAIVIFAAPIVPVYLLGASAAAALLALYWLMPAATARR